MKRFMFVMAMILTITFVGCSTSTDNSAALTESSTVQADSLTIDSTAVDTTKAIK